MERLLDITTEEHYVDRCAEIVSARDRGAQGESNG